MQNVLPRVELLSTPSLYCNAGLTIVQNLWLWPCCVLIVCTFSLRQPHNLNLINQSYQWQLAPWHQQTWHWTCDHLQSPVISADTQYLITGHHQPALDSDTASRWHIWTCHPCHPAAQHMHFSVAVSMDSNSTAQQKIHTSVKPTVKQIQKPSLTLDTGSSYLLLEIQDKIWTSAKSPTHPFYDHHASQPVLAGTWS